MIRSASYIGLLLALNGCAALHPAFAGDALDQLQARIIKIGDRVTPSVVHIEAAVKQNNRRNIVTGSGFFIDDKGTILTNEHVVERAQKVEVVLSGRAGSYLAEVIGTDKQTDIAVIKIERREGDKPFPAARLGDSEKLKVGEWVIAIGNPYGLDGTVSLGIVSAKGRDLQGENLLNDFIQTDAMIDRGSSGGPLVNLKGEVVGVNSRGQGRGIGFTIPIDTAKRVASDLHGEGQIARGYLGVAIQPLDRELADYWKIGSVHGVIVTGVVSGSPADEAGVLIGDILTEFDGNKVKAEKDEDVGQFQRLVARGDVGKRVNIRLLREGEKQKVEATLGRQPKVVPDEEETDYGFSVQEVTESLYRQQRLDQREGVLVSFVENGSEAAEAGMHPGDLIIQVEGTEIGSIDSFRSTMQGISTLSPFLVKVRRGNDYRYILIVPRKNNQHAHTGIHPS